jgi:hypothetical protein
VVVILHREHIPLEEERQTHLDMSTRKRVKATVPPEASKLKGRT